MPGAGKEETMLRTACYTDIGGRPQNEDTVLQAQLGVGQLCTVVADGRWR